MSWGLQLAGSRMQVPHYLQKMVLKAKYYSTLEVMIGGAQSLGILSIVTLSRCVKNK